MASAAAIVRLLACALAALLLAAAPAHADHRHDEGDQPDHAGLMRGVTVSGQMARVPRPAPRRPGAPASGASAAKPY